MPTGRAGEFMLRSNLSGRCAEAVRMSDPTKPDQLVEHPCIAVDGQIFGMFPVSPASGTVSIVSKGMAPKAFKVPFTYGASNASGIAAPIMPSAIPAALAAALAERPPWLFDIQSYGSGASYGNFGFFGGSPVIRQGAQLGECFQAASSWQVFNDPR